MLHTKFQSQRPFGSGKEELLIFLPYMGTAAILVMWPGPFEQTFVPLSQGGSTWNLVLIGPVVSNVWKCWQHTYIHYIHTYIHTHGRQRQLTYEPKGSGGLKMVCAPSEDSDQPRYPPSLNRVFAVRSKDIQGPKASSCGQRRLWSDWADAQADLSSLGAQVILLVLSCCGSYDIETGKSCCWLSINW